jgi:hypothetical protein
VYVHAEALRPGTTISADNFVAAAAQSAANVMVSSHTPVSSADAVPRSPSDLVIRSVHGHSSSPTHVAARCNQFPIHAGATTHRHRHSHGHTGRGMGVATAMGTHCRPQGSEEPHQSKQRLDQTVVRGTAVGQSQE